jgi:thiol-disulfide isomerase/thioredoxin
MKRLFTLLTLIAAVGSLHAQLLFQSDFESGVPAQLTVEDAWDLGNATTLSSTYFAIPEHGDFIAVNDDAVGAGVNLSGRIISPPLDLTGFEGASLLFEAFFLDGDYGQDEQANVLVSTDAGATWTQIMTLQGAAEWQSIQVDLGDYLDQTINLAIEYTDGTGWNYGLAVDDIAILGLIRDDVRLVNLSTVRYHVVNEEVIIEGTVRNMGLDNLTSFDISYTIDGNTYTETVDGIDLGFNGEADFAHSTAFIPAEAITYDLAVEVSNPNGEADLNDYDNSTDAVVSAVTFRPDKKVVIEEGTGTWCGWCPRGAVAMEYMKENYPESFIGIAVHNGDPMVVDEHDDNIQVSGYPGCDADRSIRSAGVSTDLFIQYHEQLNQVTPVEAEVTAKFYEDTRELEVEVSAEYVTRLSGLDHRFSVILIEDGVTGTSSGYAQANYYDGGGAGPLNGAGHDWTTAGDPVPASQMVYDDVSRAILGGYFGTSGVIAADVEAADVFTQTFTYTVPNNFNWEKMHAVVLVLDGSTGAIMNADAATFDLTVGTQPVFANELLDVFPNPSRGDVNIALELAEATTVHMTVYNANGQQVATENLGKLAGEVTIPFDGTQLPAGVYSFHLNLGDRVAVKQIVIK